MIPRLTAAIACFILLVIGFPGSSSLYASPSSSPGSYYLALGDSLAYGVTTNGVAPDPQCKSASAPGYVCVFYRYLQQINPQIQLVNLSYPSEDSCELVRGYGNGSPCTRDVGVKSLPSPLDAATTLIKAHPGQVSPITVNMGANDLLALLPEAVLDLSGTAAKLPAVMKAYQANLDTALQRIRAAAPDAKIIISTQYNPVAAIPAALLPNGFAEIANGAINSLNGIITQEAQKYNVVVADVAAAFAANPNQASLTFAVTSLASGDITKFNPHATPDGYMLWGKTVIKTSGYVAPLKLTVHVAKKQVARGKKERVSGTTSAGASLTVKVWLPGNKRHSYAASAGASGTYARSFKVGKAPGSGAVQVCASDVAGQTKCSARMRYAVR